MCKGVGETEYGPGVHCKGVALRTVHTLSTGLREPESTNQGKCSWKNLHTMKMRERNE